MPRDFYTATQGTKEFCSKWAKFALFFYFIENVMEMKKIFLKKNAGLPK